MPQIPDLPVADSINSGDLLIISQAGITKATTYAILQTGINSTTNNITLNKSQPTISLYDTDGGSANYKLGVNTGTFSISQINSGGTVLSSPVVIDSAAQSLHLKSTGSTLGANLMVGSSSTATDNHIARFDGATGAIIQTSGATIDDSGNITATNLSGTNTGDQTNITGNAGTATALQTARNINGVSFDGTADITITAAASTLTGTILATNVVTSSLTTVGVIGAGTWQGAVVVGQYGGTGVANTGKTITIGGNLSISGAFTTAITVTGNTTITLPTTGILYGTATGSITSAQFAGSLTDETGSGSAVFATSPTLITPVLGVATATSINTITFTGTSTPALTVTGTTSVSGVNTGDQFTSIAANTFLANAAAGSAAATASVTLTASTLAGRGSTGNLAPIAPDGTTISISGTTLGLVSSAALPGSPTTTTQTSTDSSTKVATTAFVVSAVPGIIAGLSAGAVGTYAYAIKNAAGVIQQFGDTLAGSSLVPCSGNGGTGTVTSLSGTWRCMGFAAAATTTNGETLWLRTV